MPRWLVISTDKTVIECEEMVGLLALNGRLAQGGRHGLTE